MEETNPLKINQTQRENEEEEWRKLCQKLIQTLPNQISSNGNVLHLYEGFWYPGQFLKALLYFQRYFKPERSDIFLASNPKCGTHWLAALAFTVANRSRYTLNDTPLLRCIVPQVVTFLDLSFPKGDGGFPDFDELALPRIFATHASYDLFPSSIKDSENKIVYICRNPLDQFISLWNFLQKIPHLEGKKSSLDDAFEKFCQGNHEYGPFWDHILGFWRASIERPDKVLFLKYENLKSDSTLCLKKLATFLGFPFTKEEEEEGMIQNISNFCGIENMKNFEVNKTGKTSTGIPNTAFYRIGQVGDFYNYLSRDKIVKMEKLVREKLGPFGLSFKFS